MKILLTGSNGQLGLAIQRRLANSHWQLLCTSRAQLDVTDEFAVKRCFETYRPDVVINCAAYTNVEQAETERDQCWQVNAIAPTFLATACHICGSALIHISSDYVFSGEQTKSPTPTLYTEQCLPEPINYYGASKLAGEQAIVKISRKYIILRSSWLFSEFGHNFYRTMLRLASNKQSISVVDDQIGSPTYAGDLAAAIQLVLVHYDQQHSLPWGLYHIAGIPTASWFQFAKAIFESHHLQTLELLHPIKTNEYKTVAKRPAYSALNSEKFCHTFNFQPLDWQASLQLLAKTLSQSNANLERI